jgi:ABC-2 type transport system ATP-binding protein
MGQLVIEVRDLVKRYAKQQHDVVAGISFEVRAGEIFGLLGPNGAGKTTTIGMLTTRISITSGTALVSGTDVAADPVSARARISAVPQKMTLDRAMTARQNLMFHAAYHDLPRKESRARADELLEAFDLTEQAKAKPDFMSGGQQQRLMIARALMHEPDVLFLDEPTTGLDPQVRRWLWDRVRRMRDAGAAIVLTTHYLEEAAELSDRLGIIDHGKLIALDTPAALSKNLPGTSTLDVAVALAEGVDTDPLLDKLGGIGGVVSVERLGTDNSNVDDGEQSVRARLYLDDDPSTLIGETTSVATAAGGRLTDLSIGRPSLEDVFISLTGRSMR